MTPPDDDSSDMDSTRRNGPLSDSDINALLAGRVVPAHPGLQNAVALMRTAANTPAPAPSAALAAVLAAGFGPLPTAAPVLPPSFRWRRRAAQVALAAVAGLTATAGAAAANVLPAPVQSAIADAVEALTPLQVPRPESPSDDEDAPRGGSPADAEISTTPPPTDGPDGLDQQAPGTDAPVQQQRPGGITPRRADAPAPIEAPDADEDVDGGDPDEQDTERNDNDVDRSDGDGDGVGLESNEPDSDADQRDDVPDADQPDSGEPDADAASAGEPASVEPDNDELDAPVASEPGSDELEDPQLDQAEPQ